MKVIIAARLKFKAPHILKQSTNPHYKNKYADLETVLGAIAKPMADAGLAIFQTLDGHVLKTMLAHESGESIESRYPLPEGLDPQKFASAITYARRYSILAILNLASEDDDGETASRSPELEKLRGVVGRAGGEVEKLQKAREWWMKRNVDLVTQKRGLAILEGTE